MPALVAKYWFERIARLPIEVDIASEFRYREAPLDPRTGSHRHLAVGRDRRHARRPALLQGARARTSLAIVNVPESTIAREAEVVFRTYAGPEIGVASTKAFTCQLTVLACLAIAAGRQRGAISREKERELVRRADRGAAPYGRDPEQEKHIADIAKQISHARDVLYLGRGINYPIALEGALKLKEISYIHAEGYAAGELKHGPIALIDENVPVDRDRAARRSL